MVAHARAEPFLAQGMQLVETIFELEVEKPKFIALREECNLARLAVARHPASRKAKLRLSALLIQMDQFDEAVALLDVVTAEVEDYEALGLLASALLSRETAQDTTRAAGILARTVDLTDTPRKRANALALLGKAQLRCDDAEGARHSLTTALAAEPGHRDAYKRLVALDLRGRSPGDVLDTAGRMMAQGESHALVLMSAMLAHAQLGHASEARALSGLDRFLHRATLTTPPGWSDLTAFNAALVEELATHPGLRFNRYGVASEGTWRVDDFTTRRSPCAAALQGVIERAVRAYVADLPAEGHPWLVARPARGRLHNWCVMTDGDGFETWHLHQNGWLSGVYYVDVPEAISAGEDERGCLAFGLPSERVGVDAAEAFGTTLIRPRSGLLMLFPSHAFHRTFPHRGERRRVCVAFDIQPL